MFVLQQYLHIMGCEAAYPNSVCMKQSNTQPRELVLDLLRNIKLNKFFFTDNNYSSIRADFEKNPSKYQLIPPRKLLPCQPVPNSIMEKWKLILFGLDTELQNYNKCLTYSSLSHTQINSQINPKIQSDNQRSVAKAYTEKNPIKLRDHKNFKQIDNDANRTLNLSEIEQNILKTVLKRLTNFFPKMGYTQGLNCIAGYLIKVGYSQQDTYWMIIHLAINKRYMLLGLFEDEFPLSRTYAVIFKNVLKRQASELYKQFYETNHFMQDQLWFFKWFTTYYIYSFPLQMIMYVFDFVIQRGGLALISLAAALVKYFERSLITIQQENDISLIFNPLKTLQNFNQKVCMSDLMRMACQIEIMQEDCSNLNIYSYSPYAEYIVYSLKYQKSTMQQYLRFKNLLKTQEACFIENKYDPFELQERMNIILSEWYQRLISQRQLFLTGKESQQKSKNSYKDNDSQSYKNIQKLKDINQAQNRQEQQPAPIPKQQKNQNTQREIRQSKISINIISKKPQQQQQNSLQSTNKILKNNLIFRQISQAEIQQTSEKSHLQHSLKSHNNHFFPQLDIIQKNHPISIPMPSTIRKRKINSSSPSNSENSQWEQDVYITMRNSSLKSKNKLKVKTQQEVFETDDINQKIIINLDKIDTQSVKDHQQYMQTNIRMVSNLHRQLFNKRYNEQISHTSSYISDANEVKELEDCLPKNHMIMAGKSIVANLANQNNSPTSLIIDYPKRIYNFELQLSNEKQKYIKTNKTIKKQKNMYPHDIFETSYGIKDQILCQKSIQQINLNQHKISSNVARSQIGVQFKKTKEKNIQVFKKNNKQDPQISNGKHISCQNVPGPIQGKSQTFIFEIDLPNNLHYSSSENKQAGVKSMKQHSNF